MKLYILRWNPNISSYKTENHLEIVNRIKNKELPDDFNWSIREHENLAKDDMFILQQVGTDNDGIAMIGKFRDECYQDESWRQDGSTIYYADMWIMDAFDCNSQNPLPADRYQILFPQIDWHSGHSGIVVEEDLDDKLVTQIEQDLISAGIWQPGELDKFMAWDFEKEIADKIILNAKELYLKEKTKESFFNFVGCLINTKVLIPMHVEKDEEGKDRCYPMFLTDDKGKPAYPIFSNESQIGDQYQEEGCEVYEIPVPLVIEIVKEDKDSLGLVLDPFTVPFLIDKEMGKMILEISNTKE